jgi:hypothetical protein
LLDRLVFELSGHLFLVESVHVFIGAPELVSGHGQVADARDRVAGLLAESPPAHRDDEGDGQDAHDRFEQPGMVV